MTNPAYRFQFGKFECRVFQAGGGPRPLNSFLTNTSAEDLKQGAEDYGMDPEAVDFSLNILVIKSGDETILVDTGLPPGMGDLSGQLGAEGIDPSAVTLVIITHAHLDHIGGILNAAGELNYPNARYAIWKTEWEHEIEESRLADPENGNSPVWNAVLKVRDRVTPIVGGEEEAEIMPGICAIPAPGHTIGHIAVELQDGGERLLHIVDAAHNYVQIAHTDWIPRFDYDGKQAVMSRTRLFQRAARDRSTLMAYHFPFPAQGRIVERGGQLRWENLT